MVLIKELRGEEDNLWEQQMENKRVVVFGYPNIGEHFIKLMYYNCNGS